MTSGSANQETLRLKAVNPFVFYKPIAAVVALFTLVTAAQAVFLKIPPSDFSEITPMIGISLIKFLIFMAVLCLIAFVRGGYSIAALKARVSVYCQSEVFLFGLMGTLLMLGCSILFILQKCFIPYFNGFGFWDPIFVGWEKALHAGHFPQEWMISLVAHLPWLPKMLDITYGLWFIVLYLTGAYCLYCDRNLQRRLHFLWGYVLTFIVGGSIAALAFSSVGPIFYAELIAQGSVDPYAFLHSHLAAEDARVGLSFVHDRHWLVDWTTDAEVINLNSISAMPSMHNATMLFAAIYLKSVNRTAFWLVAGMTPLVFLASVYCGFHYAIDGYAGYLLVLALWPVAGWAARRSVKRLCPDGKNVLLTR